MGDVQWKVLAEVIVATCATSTREVSTMIVTSILRTLVQETTDLADKETQVIAAGLSELGDQIKRTARTTQPVLPVIAALVELEDAVRDWNPARCTSALLVLDGARNGDPSEAG